MRTVNVPLFYEDGTHSDIWPYLVGDAAFPIGQHMMKVIQPHPPQGSAQAKFNRRLLNARRLMEQAFGRLKGRSVFCSKNSFWNNVDFTRKGIEVCCARHNYLEERLMQVPEMDEEDDELELPIMHVATRTAWAGCSYERSFGCLGCRTLKHWK
jgi:hypothetical protein